MTQKATQRKDDIMKKYKYKCVNCGIKFVSKSKDYQDLCSQKCMNEIEKYLIETKD